MADFNWWELAVGIMSAVISYIAGHKVGKSKGCD